MQNNLLELAELVWRQAYPNPTDETPVSLEEVVATAKYEYMSTMWRLAKEERAQEGVFNVPSNLLATATLKVVNNEMDISQIRTLRSLPDDMWLQNIGGITCTCRYVKSSLNLSQLLCDDDSLGNARTYFAMENKIHFPQGTHKDELPIIYAKMSEDVDGDIEIADAVGSIIRQRLVEIYLGKVGPEDTTNNSSSNQ